MRGVPSRQCRPPGDGLAQHLGGAFTAPRTSFYDTVIEMGGEVSYDVDAGDFEWLGPWNGFRSVLWDCRLSAVRDMAYWTESRHRSARDVSEQLRCLLFTHTHHNAPFPQMMQIVDLP